MVRSMLDYASIIWSSYLQKNIQALESVQRRSTRIVLNNTHPMIVYLTCLLIFIGAFLLTEKEQRLLIDIVDNSLLTPSPCNHSTRGHPKRFLQLPAIINAYSIFFQVMKLFIQ